MIRINRSFINKMKTILTVLLLLLSISTFAQLKIDSLTGIYSYQKNCLEKLIVKGKPELVVENSKKMGGNILKIKIDSIYYVDDHDTIATNCGIAFLFERSDSIKSEVLESNLFVLKKCNYVDMSDRSNSRVIEYYTLIDAVYTTSSQVKIIERSRASQCLECHSFPERGKYFWNRNKHKNKKYPLTKAEKWIIKERIRICD